MVELIASGIIIMGTECGVWSESHPGLYPPPTCGGGGWVEQPYELGPNESELTYEDGTPVIL